MLRGRRWRAQVMHSQAVEDSCQSLAPERGARLLLAAGAHLRTAAGGVALLAMSSQDGYLAPRGRLPLPPLPPGGGAAPPPPRPPPRSQARAARGPQLLRQGRPLLLSAMMFAERQ